MDAKVTIIDSDAAGRAAFKLLLEREKLAGIVTVGDDAASAHGVLIVLAHKSEPQKLKISDNNFFMKPVRAGDVLDRVRRLLAAENSRAPELIRIGPYELDVIGNELRSEGGPSIRLTDKEKNILLILSDRRGEAVERPALLERVWGYAEGLDTHTLETHIYRLRQKIENDPAKPEILITDGAGYRIA